MDFLITPRQLTVAGAVLVLAVHGVPEQWTVTLTINRPASAAAIESGDVDLRAVDAAETELRPVQRPEGTLTEVGGSLGMSANAGYVFAGASPPRTVIVHWSGEAVRFAISAARP